MKRLIAYVSFYIADERVGRDAALGVESPVKAGLWSISAARAMASHIGTRGGFDAEIRTGIAGIAAMIGGYHQNIILTHC